eukprot:scaffold42395_cov30-Tisochrysis_lutea.AAC.2
MTSRHNTTLDLAQATVGCRARTPTPRTRRRAYCAGRRERPRGWLEPHPRRRTRYLPAARLYRRAESH